MRDAAKHRLLSRAAELDEAEHEPSEKERARLEAARQGQLSACDSAFHGLGTPPSRRQSFLQLACTSLPAVLPSAACSGQAGTKRKTYQRSMQSQASQAEDIYAEVIRPPKTLKRPHKLVSPDGTDTRQDPYYWLRDDKREDPEVIQHLEVHEASSPSPDYTPLRLHLLQLSCRQLSPSS